MHFEDKDNYINRDVRKFDYNGDDEINLGDVMVLYDEKD